MEDIQIIIGGAAGEGTKATGRLIAEALNQYGYKVFVYEEYASLIRGGHNFSAIRASRENRRCIRKTDFLLALNKETVDRHKKDLSGVLIYNSDKMENEDGIGISAETIAKEEGGEIMKSNALFGGLCKILGVEWEVIEKVLDNFPQKEKNLKVIKRTFDSRKESKKLEKKEKPLPLLNGNEAIALGALQAGMESYFAYPMTPATGILHFLAKLKEEYKITVFQPENEIAVINAALGCAYAGKRAMVGTSGGGFALMTEGVSLAAMSETPIVIVEGQRAGPSTGVPTYSGQSDLNFVLHPGHGDFLHLVFAPGDAEEAFCLANLAMNMSWKYQIPSIVLIDKDISESTFSFDKEALQGAEKWEEKKGENSPDYCRYKITEDGVSPLRFPGEEAVVKSSSYESDEYGISTEEGDMISKMQEKRRKKKEDIIEELEKKEMVKVYGEGEKVLFCWGCAKLAAIEAGKELGYRVVQPLVFQPFPEKQIKEALKGATEVVVVEYNSSGQAAEILKHYVKVDKKILKYDGRPFKKEELMEKL